jgi:hypothetical protein
LFDTLAATFGDASIAGFLGANAMTLTACRVANGFGQSTHIPKRLRSLALTRASEAWDAHRNAKVWAQRHQVAHNVVGIGGIAAGAIAGLTILAEWVPLVPIVAAFAASVLAGVQTFIKSQRLADMHWKQRAGFGRLAQDYEAAAAADGGPTEAELNELAKRRAEVEGST